MSLTSWVCERGSALLIPSGKSKHLHVVLCKPQNVNGRLKGSCVLVNVSTIREGVPYDDTCVLDVGQHPFLNRPSFVYYKMAIVYTEAELLRGLTLGLHVSQPPFDDGILEIIIDGIFESPFASPWLNEFKY